MKVSEQNPTEAELECFWRAARKPQQARRGGLDTSEHIDDLEVIAMMTESPMLKRKCQDAINQAESTGVVARRL